MKAYLIGLFVGLVVLLGPLLVMTAALVAGTGLAAGAIGASGLSIGQAAGVAILLKLAQMTLGGPRHSYLHSYWLAKGLNKPKSTPVTVTPYVAPDPNPNAYPVQRWEQL